MPDQNSILEPEPPVALIELRHECHRLIALGKYGMLELACGKCGGKIYLDPPALRGLADWLESEYGCKMTLP